jgi:hypothetical protein
MWRLIAVRFFGVMALFKIEDRRTALNDAPRLDAVQITGVKQIGRPDRGLTVISGGK